MDRRTLATSIVSVAVTCGDCGDHHAATQYYERELALWKGESPSEVSSSGRVQLCLIFISSVYTGLCCQEYESWVQIAQSRRKAGNDRVAVRAALEQALVAAQQMNCNQKVVSVVWECPLQLGRLVVCC